MSQNALAIHWRQRVVSWNLGSNWRCVCIYRHSARLAEEILQELFNDGSTMTTAVPVPRLYTSAPTPPSQPVNHLTDGAIISRWFSSQRLLKAQVWRAAHVRFDVMFDVAPTACDVSIMKTCRMWFNFIFNVKKCLNFMRTWRKLKIYQDIFCGLFVESPIWTELQNVQQVTSSTVLQSGLLSGCSVYVTSTDDVTPMTSLQGVPQTTSSSGGVITAVAGVSCNAEFLQLTSEPPSSAGVPCSSLEVTTNGGLRNGISQMTSPQGVVLRMTSSAGILHGLEVDGSLMTELPVENCLVGISQSIDSGGSSSFVAG